MTCELDRQWFYDGLPKDADDDLYELADAIYANVTANASLRVARAEPGLREALKAAKQALQEQFDRKHDNDWSVADADRFGRDKAVLDKHLAALEAHGEPQEGER